MKKAERPCQYCGAELKGTRHKVACAEPECKAKHKADMKKYYRKREREARLKEKMRHLKDNPKFCIHCGEAFGLEDNLRYPACNRCRDWWEENRLKVRKRREWRSKKKRMDEKKGQEQERKAAKRRKLARVELNDGNWSQDHYEALQKKLEKPNGRKCQWWKNFGGDREAGCTPENPGALVGNDRYYCKEHQERLKQVAFRTDDLYLYDGESYSGYDVW